MATHRSKKVLADVRAAEEQSSEDFSSFQNTSAAKQPEATEQPVFTLADTSTATTSPSSSNETELSWTAPEFIDHAHSVTWYVVLSIVIVIFVGGSIWFNSPLAAILFALIGLLVFLYATRKPAEMKIKLTSTGLFLNKSYYPYSQFRSFWIFYEPDIQELSVQTTRPMVPFLRVVLGTMDPVRVREFLLKHVPEVEQEEPLMDMLARLLKI